MNGGYLCRNNFIDQSHLAPINALSGALSTFDFVGRVSKNEENDEHMIRIPLNTLEQIGEDTHDVKSHDFYKVANTTASLKSEENLSDLSEDKFHFEKKQPTVKPIQRKRTKKEFNETEYIKEERRRLLLRLENSENDKVVFYQRIKKLRKNAKHGDKSYRGSRYWGVSKNKSKWQVMITLNHYKEYSGGFSDELEAARIYDRKSICTYGLKAKTNFSYTKQEVLEIVKNDDCISM